MARLELQGLSKVFQGPQGQPVHALRDVTLTVEDHELLVLVGPSGSGKTTTLRLIAGLEEPTSGATAIDGRVVNAVPPKDRDVGMVFQHHALYPHLTVREQLALPLRLRKIPRAEADLRVRETAAVLELTAVLDRLPSALSGGERQRVALGRALIRRPGVLLLDEPLSDLDAPLRARLRREIADLQARLGTTLLYVTHDQAEAMALGHRLAVLRAGALEQVGRPLDVYRRPASVFVAGFIGSPPMNFFRGRLAVGPSGPCFEEESAAAVTGGGLLRLPLPAQLLDQLGAQSGRGVLLGLRPEAFSPASSARAASASFSLITAEVERFEAQGADVFIHCTTGLHRFTARLPSSGAVAAGQRISLAIDLHQARFFDPATEQALSLDVPG